MGFQPIGPIVVLSSDGVAVPLLAVKISIGITVSEEASGIDSGSVISEADKDLISKAGENGNSTPDSGTPLDPYSVAAPTSALGVRVVRNPSVRVSVSSVH